MAANVISAATATGATSYSPNFGAAMTAGDTILVGVCTVGTGITITGLSDGTNTYTSIAHTNNGANGNDCRIFICTGAKARSTSNALTASVSGGNFTSITVRADTFTGALSVVGTPTVSDLSSSATQQVTSATTNSTEQLWSWMQQFSSSTSTTGNYTDVDVDFTRTALRCSSGSSNAACSGWAAPGAATATCTASFTWDGSHTGRGIIVVLDTAPPTSLSLTGKRGATASAHSRYGSLTTTGATILSLTGKKSTFSATDGRFGQFTAEYLNSGGVAWADARFGDLSSAAAITALTGLKGAIGLADSRYGTLTTNTRGNLALRGTKTAHLVGESRFGLLSLFGEAIQGLPTTYASADSRFGSLLLHNRTPGVVTIRAENRGLVSIRLGN